ncbi:hypothetical protein GOP47_0007978 [Adiantum capillus-veneris]|uniref:Uncharacterized protein n=1 Tax=Adiantum capillus-veneris TaxID=13818 RepID=A0A9D4V235_ADICA|nr:hypothetical protein GOP47_0007978 [Adiantum capillus-veneris]
MSKPSKPSSRRAPHAGLQGSNMAPGGGSSSKQQSAMKRPQRGLGVAELERIRLQEEQQEHLLYLHNAELQQHFMSAYCKASVCMQKPPLPSSALHPAHPHFSCNAHISAHASNYSPSRPSPPSIPNLSLLATLPRTFIKPPSLTSTIDNPDSLITAAAPPQSLAPPPTFILNPNHDFISAAALPSPPHSSFIPTPATSCSPYIIPILGTSPSANIRTSPHNLIMSTNYGDQGLLDLQYPNQQEHSFFPMHRSSCLHVTFQAAENNVKATYNATVENEEIIHSLSFPSCPPSSIKQLSAYNNIVPEALSPALQKSMELELPSFQKQQDMENHFNDTWTKCCLDLNLTQQDYDIAASFDATRPPWKIKGTSKDRGSFSMGSLPRDNFLKLGPPIAVERAEEQMHLYMHTNIMKSFEGSKALEENSSHNNVVKANVVAKLDLNLKLSLPNLGIS